MPETLEIGGWTVEVDRAWRIVQLHDTTGRKRLGAGLRDRLRPDKIAGLCWTYEDDGSLDWDQPDHYFNRDGDELSPEPEAGKWCWLVDLIQEAGLELPPEGD